MKRKAGMKISVSPPKINGCTKSIALLRKNEHYSSLLPKVSVSIPYPQIHTSTVSRQKEVFQHLTFYQGNKRNYLNIKNALTKNSNTDNCQRINSNRMSATQVTIKYICVTAAVGCKMRLNQKNQARK